MSIDGNYSAILSAQLAVQNAAPKSFIKSAATEEEIISLRTITAAPKARGKQQR